VVDSRKELAVFRLKSYPQKSYETPNGRRLLGFVRARLVADTPEERVRQDVLRTLVDVYGYPESALLAEEPVARGSADRTRADVLVELPRQVAAGHSVRQGGSICCRPVDQSLGAAEAPGKTESTMTKRGRRLLPFEATVLEIRAKVAEANTASSCRHSDDTDQYYVAKAGFSPMLRTENWYAEAMSAAEALASTLPTLGPGAAEAVAKGLRTQGRWRELLLPYAVKYRHTEAIHESLMLIAKRKNDPIGRRAVTILQEEGH
jgi:hypothetical protein